MFYRGHNAGSVLSRSEIVTLINTFNRLSESIAAIERFGTLYKERLERELEQSSPSSATTTATTGNQKIIKAPSKEEDDNDALVYKVWLNKLHHGTSAAYSRVDALLGSRNITMHRTALRNLASWIP